MNNSCPKPYKNLANCIIKRVVDLLFSILVITAILPWVWLFVFIIQGLIYRRRILFIQERTGYQNSVFRCIKFRTLAEESVQEGGESVSLRLSRTTAFCRFLRNTNIDELPQFLNVFSGQMSVIGPRPHMLSHTTEFSLMLPSYSDRHLVKPGITGLAQVSGFRGEITHPAEIKARLKADKLYIQHWSLKLDFIIFLKTIQILSITFINQLTGCHNKSN